jgi:hypothetical protein
MKFDLDMAGTGDALDGLLVDHGVSERLDVDTSGSQYFDLAIPQYQGFEMESPEVMTDLSFLQAPQEYLQMDLQEPATPELEQLFHDPAGSVRVPAQEVYRPFTIKQQAPENRIEVLARVMRRVAHDTPRDILATEEIPDNLRSAVDQTLRYAGLAGKVFVWASAYPGCHKGQWVDHARKHASQAKYLIAKTACAECTQAREGRCAVFHKELVTDVPWDKALKDYKGVIDATKTAREGSPQQILKTALHRDAGIIAPAVQHKPVAASLVREVKAPEQIVRKSAADQWHDKLVRLAGRFVRLGFVTEEQVHQNPRAAIEQGAYRLAVQEAREYQGSEHAHVSDRQARVLGENERETLVYRTAMLEVQPLIKAGRLTSMEAMSQLKAGKTAFQIWQSTKLLQAPTPATQQYTGEGAHLARLAKTAPVSQATIMQHVAQWSEQAEQKRLAGSDLLAQVEAKLAAQADARVQAKKQAAEQVRKQVQASEYSGIPATPLQSNQTPRKTVTAALERQASRWVLQQMNEGFAGPNLDELVRIKWAAATMRELQASVDQVRQDHEGAAGFLYVATEAYATPEGTEGCRVGGQRHRTNGIKMALTMPRCSSCQHASQALDGSVVCNQYRKVLVDEIPGKEMIQQMNIANQQLNSGDVATSYFSDPAKSVLAFALSPDMPVEIGDRPAENLMDIRLDRDWRLG